MSMVPTTPTTAGSGSQSGFLPNPDAHRLPATKHEQVGQERVPARTGDHASSSAARGLIVERPYQQTGAVTYESLAQRFGVCRRAIQKSELRALKKMRLAFEKMAREEGITLRELLSECVV